MSHRIRTLCAVLLAIILLLPACGADYGTPVMTWDEDSVSDAMYSYWLSTMKATFLYYYNNALDNDAFWDTVLPNGQTAEAYATSLIYDKVKSYLIGIRLFRELGLKIPAETTQAISDDIAEKTQYYGGKSALNEALAVYGINIDILRQIYIIEAKLDAVYTALFGTGGAMAPDSTQIEQYFANHYVRIKYIQIYTGRRYVTDETGAIQTDENGYYLTQELTNEEKAAQKEKVDAMMEALAQGTDFETLSDTYAETDISYYENGFYLSTDSVSSFGTTLVTAALEMQEGEIRLVSDENATYLVQRCTHIPYASLTEVYDTMQLRNVETDCAQELYTAYFHELAENIAINDTLLASYSIREATPNSRF